MEFEIITIEPEGKRYYPSSVELGILDNGNYEKHDEIEIPLGKSRYGGPIVDLPPEIEYPKNYKFTCQIDLEELKSFDKGNLLPEKGHLIVFSDIINDEGLVIYSEIETQKLKRVIYEHQDNFWDGCLIKVKSSDTESINERFRFPEDEDEKECVEHLLNDEGKFWDCFAGSDKSKIFGMFTHCQWEQEQVLEKMNSGKIVLVQFGENGFNDEGVFSLLIDEQDLKDRNFNNCEFHWSQS